LSHKYKKYVVLQHDQKDCGCACLKMILRYYKGDINLEYLKEISGTTTKGASFLGLIQASEKIGLFSEAYEAKLDDIKKLESPFILHVELESGLQHYITCFSYNKKGFVIGDPALGVKIYSEKEILEIWKSGYVLVVNKTTENNFLKPYKREYFKWVLEMMKEDTSFYISAIFLGIIIALLNMTTLVFTEKLLDVVLPSRNLTLLFKTLSIWFFLLIFAIGLNYLRSIILIKQAYRFNIRVFRFFFKRLLKMPKSFFDSKRQGDMIARMNDTQRIQKNIKTIIADSFIELCVVCTAIIFLFSYSSIITFIILIAFPILYMCAFLFNETIKKLQSKMFGNYAQTESNYIDTISGIETIKVFNKEGRYFNKNTKIYLSFQKSILNIVKQGINQNTILDLSGTIISISGIGYAVLLAFNRVIEIGDMIAIISLVFMIIDSIKNLVQLNFEVFESKIAIERMFDFVKRSEQIDNIDKEPIKTIKDIFAINFKKISFSYPGQDYLIIDGLMELKKGEITFLKGQSGSGKSTLSQLLLKFYKQNSGEIIINNEFQLNKIDTTVWRNYISYVPQNIKIFNGDILYNITLDDSINENKVIDFCEGKLKIDSFFSKFQDTYWTVLGEEGIKPSGGEKQIIALARAIYKKPKVLILDEATSSMDELTQKLIWNLLNSIKKEMIILFITHDEKLTLNSRNNIYKVENKIISLQ
jgi:ABC-type bacteriocin/lantibiotic exporter with double-glycine peptidase domain